MTEMFMTEKMHHKFQKYQKVKNVDTGGNNMVLSLAKSRMRSGESFLTCGALFCICEKVVTLVLLIQLFKQVKLY